MSQNIHKKNPNKWIRSIVPKFRESQTFHNNFEMFGLYSMEWVRGTFNWLKQHTDFPKSSEKMYDYFWKYYVGDLDQTVMFTLKIWNVLENVKRGIPRTNNVIEGWHSAFYKLFTAKNKKIDHFCSRLKQEQEIIYQKFLRLTANENFGQKKYTITSDKRWLLFYNVIYKEYLNSSEGWKRKREYLPQFHDNSLSDNSPNRNAITNFEIG